MTISSSEYHPIGPVFVATFPLAPGQASLYVRCKTYVLRIRGIDGDVSIDLEAGDNIMSMERAERYAGHLDEVNVRSGIQNHLGEWVKIYQEENWR